MGIISWVQCTLREGFVWGGLTRIHFWTSVKGGCHMKRKKFHIKIIYLKLFGEVSSYDNPPFTLFQKCIRANFEEKNVHPKNFGYFFFKKL